MENEALLAELRQVPGLEKVPEAQLRWLIAHGQVEEWSVNDSPFRTGEPIEHLIVLLEGHTRFYRGPAAAGIELTDFKAPLITGMLPFSRMRSSLGELRVLTPVRALAVHRDHLSELVRECYELTEVLVHSMVERARSFTQMDQQTEKMVALGQMSAGLAHELNNPAAAVKRTATTLSEHLSDTPAALKNLLSLRLTEQQTEVITDLLVARLSQPAPALTMLERRRHEDVLTDWLYDHDMADAPELAGSLVDFSFTPQDLAGVEARVGTAGLATVVAWSVNVLMIGKLVLDIANAAERISTLVDSMKTYTHMDRSVAKIPISLRDGLDSTLTLLGHKIRKKNAMIRLDISPELPPVPGWPGQLNQVWTNLLDNAIDALPEQGGLLEISAEANDDYVLTYVVDNGAGIPEAVRSRIFEPFFTTKPSGQGTGLGLDIVRRIIERHQGYIKVDSVPGRTEFQVCLPLTIA